MPWPARSEADKQEQFLRHTKHELCVKKRYKSHVITPGGFEMALCSFWGMPKSTWPHSLLQKNYTCEALLGKEATDRTPKGTLMEKAPLATIHTKEIHQALQLVPGGVHFERVRSAHLKRWKKYWTLKLIAIGLGSPRSGIQSRR